MLLSCQNLLTREARPSECWSRLLRISVSSSGMSSGVAPEAQAAVAGGECEGAQARTQDNRPPSDSVMATNARVMAVNTIWKKAKREQMAARDIHGLCLALLIDCSLAWPVMRSRGLAQSESGRPCLAWTSRAQRPDAPYSRI